MLFIRVAPGMRRFNVLQTGVFPGRAGQQRLAQPPPPEPPPPPPPPPEPLPLLPPLDPEPPLLDPPAPEPPLDPAAPEPDPDPPDWLPDALLLPGPLLVPSSESFFGGATGAAGSPCAIMPGGVVGGDCANAEPVAMSDVDMIRVKASLDMSCSRLRLSRKQPSERTRCSRTADTLA
jgi:hypothetical protein